jgi:protein PhnA
MSAEENKCPQCGSPYAYPDGHLMICPECSHEWSQEAAVSKSSEDSAQFVDANGVVLENGDTVTVVKDLKAGKDTIKSGTKVKGIRLLDEPVNGHDISCKIPGVGSMYLKCSVVKKA